MLITRQKNILILGESITQGLDATTLISEKVYSIKFTVNRKEFCLSLHYNGDNRLLNQKQKILRL